MSIPFEEVEHTADWSLRVTGADLEDLLVNAARGMLHLLDVQPQPGQLQKTEIRLEAPDRESLLVSWLEELLFAMEMRRITYIEFDLELKGDLELVAFVTEAPAGDLRKHIKAVTYNALEVIETEEGFETTLVFDV